MLAKGESLHILRNNLYSFAKPRCVGTHLQLFQILLVNVDRYDTHVKGSCQRQGLHTRPAPNIQNHRLVGQSAANRERPKSAIIVAGPLPWQARLNVKEYLALMRILIHDSATIGQIGT